MLFRSGEVGKFDAATMNKQIFQATNNGGTYLVIDNAADADTVKKEVTAAGFVLDGESKALAPASFTLRFKKPMDAANTNMRPPNPIAALSGYFGNTRRGNVGAELERRVMYHADGTYQEYGALKTGASPFQSGIWFYRADGQGCMLHKFPLDQRSQVNCSTGRAVPYKQVGDKWNGADDNRPYELVKGYLYFDE